MTHDEARQIIREHYYRIAYSTDDIDQLRTSTAYLVGLLVSHMTWDSAILLAEWIKRQDAQS